MASSLEIIATLCVFAMWLLFPIGIFLSVARIDRDTDQVQRFVRFQQHGGLRGAKQKAINRKREFIPFLRPGMRH